MATPKDAQAPKGSKGAAAAADKADPGAGPSQAPPAPMSAKARFAALKAALDPADNGKKTSSNKMTPSWKQLNLLAAMGITSWEDILAKAFTRESFQTTLDCAKEAAEDFEAEHGQKPAHSIMVWYLQDVVEGLEEPFLYKTLMNHWCDLSAGIRFTTAVEFMLVHGVPISDTIDLTEDAARAMLKELSADVAKGSVERASKKQKK